MPFLDLYLHAGAGGEMDGLREMSKVRREGERKDR
jgi:hypothetical protein